MMTSLFLVALGGAIGASLRFATGVGVLRAFAQGDLPLATLTVNVVGSFLMGVFVVAAAQRGFNNLSPFIMTGVLGGFTTFSAFSLETMTLIERGNVGLAMVYIGLSVGLSVGALAIGLMAARSVFA
ncbi:fluoride efflux transporter CrcB [Marivita sp. S2033]|uniref:fluoride efflux transporter CrcB n=1 Tax=Marivita sp. S2033 TaxID=3373187 RepID=UPI003981CEEB